MKYEPISGQPQHVSEEETMSIIRSVLTEAEEPAPTRKAVRASNQLATQATPACPNATATQGTQESFDLRSMDRSERRRADDLPELVDAAPERPTPVRAPRAAGLGVAARRTGVAIFARLAAFRPSRRHLALACLALLVALRPHWFVITGVLIVVGLVGLFLIVGSDQIWRGVASYLAMVDARDPDRAARLRARMDRFACAWDSILDRFPDGAVDALYMPDVQGLQNAELAHTKALSERLNRMAHDG